MGDIVNFGGQTTLDIDPDRTLENTKGKLSGFIIAGYDTGGNEFFSSTYGDSKESLWLAERFKSALMSTEDGAE